jgi:hypothetical protein
LPHRTGSISFADNDVQSPLRTCQTFLQAVSCPIGRIVRGDSAQPVIPAFNLQVAGEIPSAAALIRHGPAAFNEISARPFAS